MPYPRTRTRFAVLLATALCAWLSVGLAVAAAPGPAAAAAVEEPCDVVVLLHPSMKEMLQPLVQMREGVRYPDAWGIHVHLLHHKRSAQKALVRFEVGLNPKAVKAWTVLIQYDALKSGVINGRTHVGAAYTIWYRPTPADAPVEICRAHAEADGTNYSHAVESFLDPHIRPRVEDVTRAVAERVLADKPTFTDQGDGHPATWVTVTPDLTANPPTATVRFNNRLPTAVDIDVQMQAKQKLGDGDQYFRLPKDAATNEKPYRLAAGEKATLKLALDGLKAGQAPKWCRIQIWPQYNAESPADR